MIRRPPISTRTATLFPYTTLFRSAGHVIHMLVIERIRYIKARLAAVSADYHIGHAEYESTHAVATIGGVQGNRQYFYVVQRSQFCRRLTCLYGLLPLLHSGLQTDGARFPPLGRVASIWFLDRSEERRVGQECVSTFSAGW